MARGLSECRGAVEEYVLREISPTPAERRWASRIVERAMEVAREAPRAAGYSGFELRVEGSYAKDTWLRGELEVDLFALFPLDRCRRVLGDFASRVSRLIAGQGFPVELRYAQHPYVRFYVDGVPVELVPGCRVAGAGQVVTAVDRTPFHTEFIRGRLGGWQRDEVRLLKSFAKGVEVYGAEESVRGFSGYLLELLVARYGCFRGVLRAAAEEWRPPVELALPGFEGSLPVLRERYPDSILYMPDPVDPRRNVGAAVSPRSLAWFILASRFYLRDPAAIYFHRFQRVAGVGPSDMGARLGMLYLVVVDLSSVEPPETLWGVARRLGRILYSGLSSRGVLVHLWEPYAPLEPGSWLLVALVAEPGGLYERLEGPYPWQGGGRPARFVERHLWDPVGPFVDWDGRIVSIRERSQTVEDLVRRVVSENAPGLVTRLARRIHVSRGLEAFDELRARGVERRWLVRLVHGSPLWMLLLASP